MDFRTLQLFEHLSRSLHFGQTASELNVSPSTLSRAIQRLEQDCSVELLLRNNRHVNLTPAGAAMADFARKTLLDWSEIRQRIQKSAVELSGDVSLYCSVTASQSHLPKLLRNLEAVHPGIRFQIQTGDPAYALDKLLNSQCDLALAIRTPSVSPRIRFDLVDTIPLVLVTPKTWLVDDINEIDWKNQSIILPERGHAKTLVTEWFAKKGIQPSIYANVGGNEAIVALVALGCGIGFVPQVVLQHSSSKAQVNATRVSDIGVYELGICALKSNMGNPLIQACRQLFCEFA